MVDRSRPEAQIVCRSPRLGNSSISRSPRLASSVVLQTVEQHPRGLSKPNRFYQNLRRSKTCLALACLVVILVLSYRDRASRLSSASVWQRTAAIVAARRSPGDAHLRPVRVSVWVPTGVHPGPSTPFLSPPYQSILRFGEQPDKVWPGAEADDEERVAICAAASDVDIDEWLIHHYYHLGVRRFYIMDDRSESPYHLRETYPIPRSALTFRYFPVSMHQLHAQQLHLYHECQERFASRHRWIAYIDTDEFFELTDRPGTSLADFLQNYETFGALAVNWIVHTSNGFLKRQASYRHNFTDCIDDFDDVGFATPNQHVKSIIQTRYKAQFIGGTYVGQPHHFALDHDGVTVDEYKRIVDGPFNLPTHAKIALHHYLLKSWEEYEEKMKRGSGMGNFKTVEHWNETESYPSYDCRSLTFYEP